MSRTKIDGDRGGKASSDCDEPAKSMFERWRQAGISLRIQEVQDAHCWQSDNFRGSCESPTFPVEFLPRINDHLFHNG